LANSVLLQLRGGGYEPRGRVSRLAPPTNELRQLIK